MHYRQDSIKLTSITDDEVVNVVVRVGVPRLQGEHWGVWRGVELDDGLHWQRPVDEERRLVVHILHMNDDALVVSICNK